MDAKLRKLESTLASAIRDMSAEDFARHPEGKWSSAEILDHLNLTYLGTIKNFERSLSAGKSMASRERRSRNWLRISITRLGFFPRGGQSPERVRPRGTPVEQLKTEIFSNLARMDRVISECDARFGLNGAIADHPTLGPLTAAEWRKFHLVHGKHHARQILRLKKKR